jgi:hypothetical protein
MKQKRGLKDLLKNNLLSLGIVIVLLLVVSVIAGDVIVKEGKIGIGASVTDDAFAVWYEPVNSKGDNAFQVNYNPNWTVSGFGYGRGVSFAVAPKIPAGVNINGSSYAASLYGSVLGGPDMEGTLANMIGLTMAYGMYPGTSGNVSNGVAGILLQPYTRGGTITNMYNIKIIDDSLHQSYMPQNYYSIWDESGADWVLDSDNQSILFGTEQDAGIRWDGADLVIDTTANLNVEGNLEVQGCIRYNCSQPTGCVTLGTCI